MSDSHNRFNGINILGSPEFCYCTLSDDPELFSVEFEYLRIEQRAEGIYYVAHPKARCPGTDFKLTSLTGKQAVFENPEHDFPKRIIYRKSDDGSLVASIDGGPNTKTLFFSFRPMSK